MLELFKELNSVASKIPTRNYTFLSNEFFVNPTDTCKRIISDYKELEGKNAKEERAYAIFEEILSFMNSSNDAKDTHTMETLGELISQLCEDRGQSNCKLLVSLINSFPWIFESGPSELLSIVKDQRIELLVYLNDQFLSKGSDKWSKNFWSSFKKGIVPEFFLLTKPNLFLECSTGFSQLIMTLNLAFDDVDKFQSVSYYAKQLTFIMGKYKLDPIRCLDLILLVCSYHIVENYEFIIELLKKTEYWPIPTLSANCQTYTKLNCGGNPIATRLVINRLNDPDVSLEYIDLVVHLIQNGFVPFAPIFDCLNPFDEQIDKYVKISLQQIETDTLEGSLNPLAMAAALPDEEGDGEPEKERELENAAETNALTNVDEDNETIKKLVQDSPKWKLVNRLLCHGSLTCGLYAMERHPEFCSNNDQLIHSFLELFNEMLSPLTKNFNEQNIGKETCPLLKLSHNGISTKQDRILRSVKTLSKEQRFIQGTKLSFYNDRWIENLSFVCSIDKLFYYSHMLFPKFGPKLILCPELIEKICSIAISDIKKDSNSQLQTLDNWIDYFRKFLLPVLGMVDDEQFISNKIFSVINLFPFDKRYFFYNELSSKLAEDNLFIKFNFRKQEKKMRSLLKSLSIDNISSKCRILANFVSCNPLSTLPSIIKQIENYDKVAELIVTSAEFFSDFGYDTLQYILLVQLSSGRATLQEDGITRKMWISRLSLFIAGLAKICTRMDMSNLFHFMIKNMHKESDLTLAILKETITGVAGIQTLYDVNWNTLLMVNSGDYLKEMGRNMILDFRKRNQLRSKKIVGYMIKFNAVSEMIIMLVNLIQNTPSSNFHFKILASKCDEATSLLWAFIELLKLVLTEEEFKANVLPFDVMVDTYCVPVEWAFNIWRDYYDSKLQPSSTGKEELIKKLYLTELSSVDLSQIHRDLFFDFWRFSLYDIHLESSLYDEEKDNYRMKSTKAKSYRDISSAKRTLEIIQKDFLTHKKVFSNTHTYLQEKVSNWFTDYEDSKFLSFLQLCVLPRLLFSPSDAIYTATFINNILGVERAFHALKCLVSSEIIGMLLFSSTVNEASNVGIFFKELLRCLDAARKENSFFSGPEKKELFELHGQLMRQLIFMLQEVNYMSIRNSIQFLNIVCDCYPIVDEHVEMVLETLELLLKDERREDIRLPANALKGHLSARLKNAEKRNKFYDLSVEEQEEEQKMLDELKLLENYSVQKKAANEKEKEEKLRLEEQVHSNKHDDTTNESERTKAFKKKEQPESIVTTSRYSDRTSTAVPATFSQTIESIYRIERLIRDADYQRIITQLQGAENRGKFQKIINHAIDVNSFRNQLKDFFRDYFNKTLKQRPDYSRSTFDIFLSKCNSAVLPNKRTSRNMYEDDKTKTRGSKRVSDSGHGRTSLDSEFVLNRKLDAKEDFTQTKKMEHSRHPPDLKKATPSRYQSSNSTSNLPKGPANLVKPTYGAAVRPAHNPSSRFQGVVPSGPKNDSIAGPSQKLASDPPKYGSTTAESHKRSAEEDSIMSNRSSGGKRQRKNDRSQRFDNIPQGPRKPATGSRFHR